MHIEALRDYCLGKAEATESMPFGDDALVFKVGEKMFALLALADPDGLRITLKCNPEHALELRAAHPMAVFPGYHMNKVHWNTVYCNLTLNDKEVTDLIDHSYDLVAPKKKKK